MPIPGEGKADSSTSILGLSRSNFLPGYEIFLCFDKETRISAGRRLVQLGVKLDSPVLQ